MDFDEALPEMTEVERLAVVIDAQAEIIEGLLHVLRNCVSVIPDEAEGEETEITEYKQDAMALLEEYSPADDGRTLEDLT